MSERAPSHNGSKRFQWKIDTLEKALDVIEAQKLMRVHSGSGHENIKNGLVYLFNRHPEIWQKRCTHEYLGELVGVSRESINRGMSRIRIENGVATGCAASQKASGDVAVSKRAPSHNGSKRFQWKIDTLEKALCVIECAKLTRPCSGTGENYDGSQTKRGLVHLFNEYAETRICTHESLAKLWGMSRESVTRAMAVIKIKNGVAF